MAHHTRTKNVINIPKHSINYQPTFFVELTVEEQGMLLNIRKKKIELLHEISQLKDELTEVNTEIEAMDTEEGYVMLSSDSILYFIS